MAHVHRWVCGTQRVVAQGDLALTITVLQFLSMSAVSLWVALSVQVRLIPICCLPTHTSFARTTQFRRRRQAELHRGGANDGGGKTGPRHPATLELSKLKAQLESARAQGKDLVVKNMLLTNALNDVKSKAQRLLVENFYVATRSAGLLDSYEEQITLVGTAPVPALSLCRVIDGSFEPLLTALSSVLLSLSVNLCESL